MNININKNSEIYIALKDSPEFLECVSKIGSSLTVKMFESFHKKWVTFYKKWNHASLTKDDSVGGEMQEEFYSLVFVETFFPNVELWEMSEEVGILQVGGSSDYKEIFHEIQSFHELFSQPFDRDGGM